MSKDGEQIFISKLVDIQSWSRAQKEAFDYINFNVYPFNFTIFQKLIMKATKISWSKK